MKYVNVRTARAMLRKVVEERGKDFIYHPPTAAACQYMNKKGDASCALGVAFAEAIPKLFETLGDAGFNTMSFPDVVAELDLDLSNNTLGVTFSQNAIDLLSSFQQMQDMQMPYGEVLRNVEVRA